MEVLVAARFIQGLGAGSIPPIAYVAIGRSLPERLRPRMFATLSTAWVLPGVIGPALAGLIGETLRLALRLPRPAAAHRGGRPAHDPRRSTRCPPAAIAEAAEAEAARAARRRLPSALLVAAGAGLITVGLTSGELVDRRRRRGHRPARGHPGAASSDTARDAVGPSGPARGGAAPRRADLHVLRRRRLRHADARGLPRAVGGGRRHRPDRRDPVVDGRLVDPGARLGAMVDRPVRPGRVPRRGPGPGLVRARPRPGGPGGVGRARPSPWPASGWASRTRRSR